MLGVCICVLIFKCFYAINLIPFHTFLIQYYVF